MTDHPGLPARHSWTKAFHPHTMGVMCRCEIRAVRPTKRTVTVRFPDETGKRNFQIPLSHLDEFAGLTEKQLEELYARLDRFTAVVQKNF